MANDDDDDDHHALTDFLNDRLPQLGLDAETYAPYLLPLLTEESQDEDEWTSVLELLQASSETHSDDEDAWQTLRRDIQAAWSAHVAAMAEQEKAASAARAADLATQLAKERQEMEQAQQKIQTAAAASRTTDDAAKRALVARYAFENDDADAQEEAAPLTNKQVAAQTALEQAQALRGQSVQTKKEEQQKTAKAKLEKARLKEERRKKATKGERKR